MPRRGYRTHPKAEWHEDKKCLYKFRDTSTRLTCYKNDLGNVRKFVYNIFNQCGTSRDVPWEVRAAAQLPLRRASSIGVVFCIKANERYK
jgi:hypothetical protein